MALDGDDKQIVIFSGGPSLVEATLFLCRHNNRRVDEPESAANERQRERQSVYSVTFKQTSRSTPIERRIGRL